jgi:hypothetical protein
MVDIIALAEEIPAVTVALKTLDDVERVLVPYRAKIEAALGPSAGNQAPASLLAVAVIFVPELKPLIPAILHALATADKVKEILQAG